MSDAWSWYVIFFIALNLGSCAWLIFVLRSGGSDPDAETVGEVVDGIAEHNNPLPAWWALLFIATLVFAVGYLVLFPGLGNFAGLLGWSSRGQWEQETAVADAKYGPIYAAYYAKTIPELLREERAIAMGGRIFANNCATCHGSDARGNPGYPDLTDDDWLYGGKPETIVQTITNGRIGAMPPLGAAVGGQQGVEQLAQYVLSLSGRDHDAELAALAVPTFTTLCAVCHGREGKGNQAMGAPNLTDDIWLHSGRVSGIEEQITNGRTSQMPAHRDLLDDEKIHLVALYVYSLSASER